MKQQFSSKFISALFCGAAISLSTAVIAQNSQSTVIVSGSRFEENLNEVPANVKVITRDEIANSTSNNIPDVLSQIGGLNVRSTNGGQLNLDATVDMGGFGPTANSNTLVLVDGQRINPIDSGGVNWASIPMDSIERIEVLQGGASVQYGNGATGGVINIITNGNRTKLNQASITYGSFGTAITNAIIRDSVDQTTYQVTANTSNTQGWRQNSAANAYAIDGKITQSFGGLDKIYTDLFYAYTNAQNPGGVVGQVGSGNPQSAKFNNVGSNTTTSNSGIRFGGAKDFTSGNIFEIDGYYSNKSTFFYSPYYDSYAALNTGGLYANYGSGNGNLNGWTMNLSPRFKTTIGSSGDLIMGYEFNQSSQAGVNSYSPAVYESMLNNYWIQNPNATHQSTQSARLLNQSVYGIVKLALLDSVDFSGGFRHQAQNASTYDDSIISSYSSNSDKNASKKYSANAGDVAFNYSPSKNQKLFVKWDQSYRFPNVDEFWGMDANWNRVFNGILRPQITQAYQIGGNLSTGSVNLNGSLFTSFSQSEILYDPSTGKNSNSANNINRRGLVIDGSSNLTKSLTVAAGGKIQKSYFATGAYSGNAIALSPDLLLNARANYSIDANWSFGGVLNYVSNQHYEAGLAQYNNLAVMPSYTVGDVYLNYTLKTFEAKFTVKNIGNAMYANSGGYSTGLSQATGGLGTNYYYYPSDGRSYFVSAKYNF
ncbi:MAG: TonB-dependent receptor [Polynucleobacter sp.]|uniref:TonB-dependent receptor n=1 Tax=Polynucleobacter sp. TaxID=2029855 RepID=UPI00271AB9CD|nr:TonB-dependent receptor [Polynucleobacter sp.]MDO8715170.1 TonB-dependent receptor [Polynucleobacter sp.]